jgi:hypothetical protein
MPLRCRAAALIACRVATIVADDVLLSLTQLLLSGLYNIMYYYVLTAFASC